MKKLALFIAVLLVAAASYGQNLIGFRPVMIVPDTSYEFPMLVKAGDLVFVTSTGTMYQLKVDVGRPKNMHYILASTARYNNADITTFDSHGASYFVDTATNQTMHGTKGFFGDVSMYGKLSTAGNVAIGTTAFDKFTVAGTSGNTVIAGTLAVSGTSALADVTATKVRALDSLNVALTKIYRGTSATAVWVDDTVHSILGFKTGRTGAVQGGMIGCVGTDTITAAPIGSLCYRAADSTMYLKIKLTGPKSARWMKVTVGK